MKHKFYKLLSLGLCFSMIAATPAYAVSLERRASRNIETYHEMADVEDSGYNAEEYHIATPNEATSSEATLREGEARTFLEYFPDPNFAQVAAAALSKTKEDPVTVEMLANITRIYGINKQISNLDGIGYLVNLKEINLQRNQITEIPSELGNLIKLTNLNLNNNQITVIPPELANLNQLTSLSLNWNQITVIPPELGNLNKLSYLYLGSNQITEIPSALSTLNNLTYLYLNDNQITDIPPALSNLRKLTALYLSWNQITEVPSELANLNNLVVLHLSWNQITEVPPELANLNNLLDLSISYNHIISRFPDHLLTLTTAKASSQDGILAPPAFTNTSAVTYDQLLSPLILQTQQNNDGRLLGNWEITYPDGTVNSFAGRNGREVSPVLFQQIGTYTVNFNWNSAEPYLSLVENRDSSLNFNSSIEVEIQNVDIQVHNITLTTRYLDDALPESTQTYMVEDGGRFEQLFDVLDNYDLVNTRLYSLPDFDVDMDTKMVTLDPVTQDYTIVLEFEPSQPRTHNVTVITRYLDDALPEHTATYEVERGAAFLESFDVLEGYDLYNSMLRTQPVFDVDMDDKTVSLDTVTQDYTIELEFDKTEYKVKLNTRYLDNHLPPTTRTDWIRYEEGYRQTYEIADGYQIANIDQLPADVLVDQNGQTVTISSVTRDYEITLEFVKKQYNVRITIVYEDGSRDDIIADYTVPHGNHFETGFTIEQGYAIKKVSFNAAGVSVNRSRQTVSINSVTSPIEITIRVR